MNGLTIRLATLADVYAVTAIYAHAVATGTASFELAPPSETAMARRMRDLLSSGFPYLVAEIEGNLAGYAYAALYRARPAYRYTVEDSLYIAPGWQHRGIGGALLNALIEAAAERGFRQMIAVIGDSDNTASIAVHAALGFAYVGTFPNVGFKFGRWLDTVLMQRPLGPGSMVKP